MTGDRRVAADVVGVEVVRRWRVRGGWQVQITRRDSGRVLQRLDCASYQDAETLARRAERDLALPVLDFCHTYLINRSALR